MTVAQFGAYLDAEQKRLHTDRSERWEHVQLIVASTSGTKLDDYPDYDDSEEEDWEAALAANPMVRHPAMAEPQE